ncbi:hypothetical protein N9V74_04925 [Alteromonas sp.]|nr:hypothetical protein [Alteromonas sp.]
MKKLILIFFSLSCFSFASNASNLTCTIKQPSNEELSTLVASKLASEVTEYSKCDDVFFSRIKKAESDLCFFDEFVIDARGSVKLGRYWGYAGNCKSHSSPQFLFFEDYDNSKNIQHVKRVYEFWQSLNKQKIELLHAKVSWFKRNFDSKFSAFFDMIDDTSEEVRISNTLRYDSSDDNSISFTVNVGKSIWLVDVYFAQDIKVTGIYSVVI